MWSMGCILAEMLNTLKSTKESEYQVDQLFMGGSCFPMSPGPLDPSVDNLDEFSFSEVTGKMMEDSEDQKIQCEQLDSIFYILGTPTELGWMTKDA